MLPFQHGLLAELDFASLITLPPVVFAFIRAFVELLNHTDIYAAITNDNPNGVTFNEIDYIITTITDFSIKFTERVMSVYPGDPILSIYDSLERYRKIVILFNDTEELFETIQDMILRLERLHDDGLIIDATDRLVNQGDRLRLACNVLVRALRHMEPMIRDHNPAFEFLTRQWFE